MVGYVEKRRAAAVPGYAWVILFVTMLAGVAAPLNQFKVPPVMPVLMERFQLELAGAGLLMSIFSITGLVLALPAGIILQKLGPKLTGLVAVGCLLGGSASGALSANAGSLFASRLFEGTGMGLIAVVAPAVIAAWFPSERRGLAMGIWATWVSLGSLIIYNLAPAVDALAGWRAVWWAGAVFALVAFCLYGLLVRMPPEIGVGAGGDKAVQGELTALNLGRALSVRSVWLLALSFACFNFVVIGVIATFFPTFLTAERGYSLGSASWITSLKMLTVVVAAPLVGWVSDRIGSPKRILLVSFFALAVWMVFPFSITGWFITASMVVLGVISGAVASATFSSVPDAIGRAHPAGIGMAIVMTGQHLGQLMGPMVFGRLVESAGWASAGYWMIAVLAVGLLAVRLANIR